MRRTTIRALLNPRVSTAEFEAAFTRISTTAAREGRGQRPVARMVVLRGLKVATEVRPKWTLVAQVGLLLRSQRALPNFALGSYIKNKKYNRINKIAFSMTES